MIITLILLGIFGLPALIYHKEIYDIFQMFINKPIVPHDVNIRENDPSDSENDENDPSDFENDVEVNNENNKFDFTRHMRIRASCVEKIEQFEQLLDSVDNGNTTKTFFTLTIENWAEFKAEFANINYQFEKNKNRMTPQEYSDEKNQLKTVQDLINELEKRLLNTHFDGGSVEDIISTMYTIETFINLSMELTQEFSNLYIDIQQLKNKKFSSSDELIKANWDLVLRYDSLVKRIQIFEQRPDLKHICYYNRVYTIYSNVKPLIRSCNHDIAVARQNPYFYLQLKERTIVDISVPTSELSLPIILDELQQALKENKFKKVGIFTTLLWRARVTDPNWLSFCTYANTFKFSENEYLLYLPQILQHNYNIVLPKTSKDLNPEVIWGCLYCYSIKTNTPMNALLLNIKEATFNLIDDKTYDIKKDPILNQQYRYDISVNLAKKDQTDIPHKPAKKNLPMKKPQ